jgi:ABC-type multidrug transport system fused ATPase/permease subunit
MIRLARYLKPYRTMILLAVVLLFAQANFDLALPDYLSRIVNVGIQQGGVENAVPEAIRQSEMEKLVLFMSAEERVAVLDSYTVGDIQAFIQYVRSFTQPIQQLTNIANVLQQTAAAAERVFEFLDEEEKVAETAEPVELDQVAGKVEFRDVWFGYDPAKPVIHGFSAVALPGQKVAIVGPMPAPFSPIPAC